MVQERLHSIDNGNVTAVTSSADHPSRSINCVCFAKPYSLGVTEPFLIQKQPFWAVLSRSSQKRALEIYSCVHTTRTTTRGITHVFLFLVGFPTFRFWVPGVLNPMTSDVGLETPGTKLKKNIFLVSHSCLYVYTAVLCAHSRRSLVLLCMRNGPERLKKACFCVRNGSVTPK